MLIDGRYAATFRFRDEPRAEGRSFVRHLNPRHGFARVLLVSGDRESEVRYLAREVGIDEVHAAQSPEQKLALVRAETARANTVFVGDGINDAPALTAATVGIAFGQASDVTTEAAGAVVLDSALERVDELFHIGRRMRRIALQSAVGGMALSVVGMLAAAGGLPAAGGRRRRAGDHRRARGAERAAGGVHAEGAARLLSVQRRNQPETSSHTSLAPRSIARKALSGPTQQVHHGDDRHRQRNQRHQAVARRATNTHAVLSVLRCRGRRCGPEPHSRPHCE